MAVLIMNKNNLEIYQQYHTQLLRIFVYYCSFANKEQYCLLKIQNYQRLLSDLQLPNYQTYLSQLDVIYCKHARSTCLDFDRFISILQPVSLLVFAEDEQQKGLNKLLSVHLIGLYDAIVSQTQFGQQLQYLSAKQLIQTSFVFLKRFEQSLFIVYSKYFSKQGRQGTQQQLKMFYNLSRELNFIPKIISKGIAYLIFLFISNKTSKSVFYNLFIKSLTKQTKSYKFDFMCFMQYLIILSHIKSNSQQQDLYKIYHLLQSIEVSQGCRQLYQIMKLRHFYLSQQELQLSAVVKKAEIQISPQKQTKTILKYIQTNQSPIKTKLGSYYDTLKTKFTKLCLKTYVQTNFYLSSTICKKLIQKICPCLSGICIDLLTKAAGRLNFDNFVHLLDAVAKKAGVNCQTIYEQVLLYGTDLYSINLIIENMKLSKKQQHTCNQILNSVHTYLKTTFEYYQNNKTINLQTYLKILQQTTIIPFILQSSQAVDIYKYVDNVQQLMSFDQFILSFKITVICKHFEYQLQGAERLIYLLQKFCQSKKGESLMKKNMLLVKQHPLYKLRLAFSDIYKSIENKVKIPNQSSIKTQPTK